MLVPGYTECLPCAVDHYKNTLQAECTKCPKHSSTVGATNASECVCGPGHHGIATDTDPNTENSCTPCEESKFKPGHGNGDCHACPAHSTTNGVGHGTCDCDEGWTGDIVDTSAASRCTECPVDTFKTQKGSMDCTACTPNSSTDKKNASTSITSCICNEGFHGDPARPEDRCDACPFSWYKDAIGPGECSRCPSGAETSIMLAGTGRKQKQMAATRLTDCVCSEGYYPEMYSEHRISCKFCAVDFYSDTLSALAVGERAAIGAAECSVCPLLSNTNNKVASSSVDNCRCTAGYEALSFDDYVEIDLGETAEGEDVGIDTIASTTERKLAAGEAEEGEDVGIEPGESEGEATLKHRCSPCKPNFFKGAAGNAKCAPCAHLFKAPGYESLSCVPYTPDEVQAAFKTAEQNLKVCNDDCEHKKLWRATRTVEALLLYWADSENCEEGDARRTGRQDVPSNIVPLELKDSSLSAFYKYEQCGKPSSEWHTCPPSSAVEANRTYAKDCPSPVGDFVVSLEKLVKADPTIFLPAIEGRFEANFTVAEYPEIVRSQLFRNKCFAARLNGEGTPKFVSFRVKCGVSADLAEYRTWKDIDCMGPSECGPQLEEVNRMKNSGLDSSTTTTTATSTTTVSTTTTATSTSTTVTLSPEWWTLLSQEPKVPMKPWHWAFIAIDLVVIIAGSIYWACKVGYLHMPKWPEKEVPKEIGYGGHFGMLGDKSNEKASKGHGQTVTAQWDIDGDVYKMAEKEEEEMRAVYPGATDGAEGNYGLGNTALPADEVYGRAQVPAQNTSDDENATCTYAHHSCSSSVCVFGGHVRLRLWYHPCVCMPKKTLFSFCSFPQTLLLSCSLAFSLSLSLSLLHSHT